jgi:competence protein ComEA
MLFLAGVVLLGAGVRVVRTDGGGPAPTLGERLALDRQLLLADSAARDEGRPRKGRGRGTGEKRRTGDSAAGAGRGGRSRAGGRGPASASRSDPRPQPSPSGRRTARASRDSIAPLVDPDRASAAELERLPGVGPALAARIVADRERRGPFGSLAGLDRVSGIGPHLLERLGPAVTFSGTGRHPGVAGVGAAPLPARPAP